MAHLARHATETLHISVVTYGELADGYADP
jgi:hypothetical protein